MIDPHRRPCCSRRSGARACRCCATSARRSRGPTPTATPRCVGCARSRPRTGRRRADLGRFLFRRHIPPSFTGSFPAAFTTINFLSLEHLLPRLVDTQRQAVADLERDAAAVTDADAKAELEKLLAVKRLHLSELEGLKVPHGEATKV